MAAQNDVTAACSATKNGICALSIDVGVRHLAVATLYVTPTSFTILDWELINVLQLAGVPDTTNINSLTIEDLVTMFVTHVSPVLQQKMLPFEPNVLRPVATAPTTTATATAETCKAEAVAEPRTTGMDEDALVDAMFSPEEFLYPSVAYIESQPMGFHACNVKTKTISHVLQGLLMQYGATVSFVGSAKKLRGLTKEGEDYDMNKKFAVDVAHRMLAEPQCLSPEWAAWFRDLRDVHEEEQADGSVVVRDRKAKKDDLADALLQGIYAARDALAAEHKADVRAAKLDARQQKLALAEARKAAKQAKAAATATSATTKGKQASAKTTKKPTGQARARKAAEAATAIDLDTDSSSSAVDEDVVSM